MKTCMHLGLLAITSLASLSLRTRPTMIPYALYALGCVVVGGVLPLAVILWCLFVEVAALYTTT